MKTQNIKTAYINPQEMQYLIVGDGVPVQTFNIDEWGQWDTALNTDGEPVFDIQIDYDDSVKLVNPLEYYQFQYVNLVESGDEEYPLTQGDDWQNADEIIVTEQPITTIIAELCKNHQ